MNQSFKHTAPTEVNIMDLFFTGLYKWKIALVCGIIFAILFGAFHYYTYNYRISSEGITKFEKESEEYTLKKAQYDHMVSAFKQNITSAEDNIALLTDEISDKQKYIDNSPVMQLDPYNYYSWKLAIYIDTDYKIMPSMTYQNKDYTADIATALKNELSSNDIKNGLAEAMGADLLYLGDIYTVSYGGEETSTETTGYIYIDLIGENEEFVQKGKDYLSEQLTAIKEKVSLTFDSFNMNLTDFGIKQNSSSEMVTLQETAKDDLITLNNELTETKNSLSAIEEPDEFAISRPSSFSHTPKMIVMGMLAGIFLVFMLEVCKPFITNTLISKGDLLRRFNVVFLGRTGVKHYRGLSGVFRRWGDSADQKDEECNIALIAQNIENFTRGIEGPVLLTGCGDKEVLLKTAGKIKEKLPAADLVFGADMFSDAETVKLLPACAAVALIEQCSVSKYRNIELEISKIQALDKKLVGVAVIE